ncbi:hypothetical protein C0Q70_16023 [Pomacea canaliculata]|uniref:cystathionine gamma-lyase n=1 Tax=Pomacea canaliculata TaxID=400727 RepID=A0A2T7NNL6_POMCA|nr:hypothetical protein C0Q70_16023 [Pomacea canaliculata]
MALINFLSAIANSTKDSSISSLVCLQSSAENNLDLMHKVLGFKIQRQLSSIPNGGTGVIVTAGFIPAGTVTSLYPGLLYQPHEPIFFQSLGNPFIFRCIDGLLIDGNDKGISRLLYKSCHGRDRLGPFSLCDASWLTNWPINPLAVGQYVNNHNKDFPANVAYQEFDLPFNFPFHLRQYLPNNFYSANVGDAGQQQRYTANVARRLSINIEGGGKESMTAQNKEEFAGRLDDNSYELETLACHVGQNPQQHHSRDIVAPISLSTTFALDEPQDHSRYRYTRVGNPTRNSLQECLAAIEGAKHAFVFSSGMAATLNIMFLLRAHDHVVCGADGYGGTYRFFAQCATRMAIETTFVDFADLEVFRKALRPNTKLVWLEPVSNPSTTVVDVGAVVQMTRNHAPHALIVADNTFLTPCLQKPLEYGVDIVLYSLTKYMNGMGSVPSPFDCFLVNRGLRTLPLRMLRHGDSALQVAQALEKNPRVSRVLYPGQWQESNLRIFTLAISLGGHESLAAMPCYMTHASVPTDELLALGITDNFVRLSVGLENPRDLIDDLEQAILKAECDEPREIMGIAVGGVSSPVRVWPAPPACVSKDKHQRI